MHNDHHKMAYTPNEMPDFNLHMYTCRHRGYYRYSVVRRYEIYIMFMWHKKNLTSEYSEWAKHCLCHKNIKFISLSQHVTDKNYRSESKVNCSSAARTEYSEYQYLSFCLLWNNCLDSFKSHGCSFFILAF